MDRDVERHHLDAGWDSSNASGGSEEGTQPGRTGLATQDGTGPAVASLAARDLGVDTQTHQLTRQAPNLHDTHDMASDQLSQAHILAQMAHIHAATQQQQREQAGPSHAHPNSGHSNGSGGGGSGGYINPSMSGLGPQRTTSGSVPPGAQGLKRQRSSFGGAGSAQRMYDPALGGPGHGLGRDASVLLSDEPEGEGEYTDESDEDDDEDGEGDEGGEDGEGKRGKGRGRGASGVTTDGQSEPPLGYLPDGSVRKKPKLTRGSRCVRGMEWGKGHPADLAGRCAAHVPCAGGSR